MEQSNFGTEIRARIEAMLPNHPLGQTIIRELGTARTNAAILDGQIARLERGIAYLKAEVQTEAEGKSEDIRRANTEVALANDYEYQEQLTKLDKLKLELAGEEAVAEAGRASLRLVVAEVGIAVTEQE